MLSLLFILNNISRTCFHINLNERYVYPMNSGKLGRILGTSKVEYQNV